MAVEIEFKFEGAKDKAILNAIEISKELIKAIEISKKLIDYTGDAFSFRIAEKEVITYMDMENYVVKRLAKSYKDDTADDFLLTVGFTLNMYYITGLYEKIGEFNIQKLCNIISEDDVKKYVQLIHNYIFSCIYCYFAKKVVIEEIVKVDENVVRIVKKADENVISSEKYQSFYNQLLKISSIESPCKYLEEMLHNYPQYRYAYMYKLCDSVFLYCNPDSENKSKANIEIVKYKNILGEELFYDILDPSSASYLSCWGADIRTQCGIPTIEIKPVDTLGSIKGYWSDNGRAVMEENINPYEHMTDDIFGEIQSILVRFVIPTDERLFIRNSILYADELNTKNEKLEKERDDKEKIIQEFSHRYKNMQASTLYKISKRLMQSPDENIKKEGRTLLVEYNIKNSLIAQVKILQLVFTNNIEKLHQNILESIEYNTLDEEYVFAYDILNDSLEMSLISIFLDDKDILKYGFWYDIPEKLKKSLQLFKKEISSNTPSDYVKWFSINLCPINISISEDWRKCRFKKDSYGYTLIKNMTDEIVKNFIKYADKQMKIDISFESNSEIMSIKVRNTKNKKIHNKILKDSTKKGLKDIVLDRINKYVGLQQETIEVVDTECEFTSKFNLKKEILMGGLK